MALLEAVPKLKFMNCPATPVLYILVIGVVFIALYKKLARPQEESLEPPTARQYAPFIVHLMGIFRYQGDYLKSLSARFPKWPIFTLKIFGSSIYVVSSPVLAQSLLCNTKSLSFMPFYIAFTNRALGARQEIKDTVAENAGDNPYMNAVHHEMYSALMQGPALVESNGRMLNALSRCLNAIGTSAETREVYEWIKYEYTIALAETFYGPQNPISDNPRFVDHIWDFEEGLPTLFMDIMPSITARKAYNARKALTPVFQEYYDKGLDRNANEFIKGRARAARAQGWTNNDLAGFEITICFAGLTNTVPNAFSMLSYVLSDRDLTAEISEEVRNAATRTTVDGVERVTINITAFNGKCPVLISAYNESLRLCVNATAFRVTTQDVILKDTYHLSKGGVVQITCGAMHESRKVWGNDVASFNGRRFLSKKLTREQKKHLLPFGGGKHLCPGRHLAFTKIVSFVAMVVLGYDVEMKDGSGLVRHPGFKVQKMGENSKKPAHDIEVLIKRKTEFENVVWAFAVK